MNQDAFSRGFCGLAWDIKAIWVHKPTPTKTQNVLWKVQIATKPFVVSSDSVVLFVFQVGALPSPVANGLFPALRIAQI